MKNYLYSNLKDEDFTPTIIDQLACMNVAGIIVDFEPTDTLCARLRQGGIIENYYAIKLWKKEPMEQVEAKIARAKEIGFHGIAIDSEPYSVGDPPAPVDLWTNPATSYRVGRELGALIKKHFYTEPVLYPEGTLFKNEDKYKYWPNFYQGLLELDTNPTIYMERTYNQWEPWNILWFYLQVKSWAKGKVVIGTWQTSFKPIPAWIQAAFTRLWGERFLYTEGTEYPTNKFYSRIAE